MSMTQAPPFDPAAWETYCGHCNANRRTRFAHLRDTQRGEYFDLVCNTCQSILLTIAHRLPPTNDAPELRSVSDDELRFYRLIEERKADAPGQELTLACGHVVWMAVPVPDAFQYHLCMECLNAWVKSEQRPAAERR